MKYDIDVVSHYSTNLTIGFKGRSVFWFPKMVAKFRECVGFGVCFVMQSTTIASVCSDIGSSHVLKLDVLS